MADAREMPADGLWRVSKGAMNSLLSRLDDMFAAPATPGPRPYLGVQAGGDYWLVDAPEAALVPVPPITPVPLTQPWFRGLVALQGSALGVVDLAALQGGAPTPVTHESRLLRLPGTAHALLLGALAGERTRAELSGVPRPLESPEFAGPRYRDTRGRFWQLLDLDRLAAQPDLMDMSL